MRTTATLILFVALGASGNFAVAGDANGGPNLCDRCGCHAACVQKTCQVVCETKKEIKTRWEVECKEICPLMPGCRDCCTGCPGPPRCGHSKCVKNLVKKEYTVDVPVYKCVVKYLCADCCTGTPAQPAAAPAPAPVGPASLVPPAPLPPAPSSK